MPVEIKELQINVTVNQQGANAESPSSGMSSSKSGDDEKKALINQCLEQMMDIISIKKER